MTQTDFSDKVSVEIIKKCQSILIWRIPAVNMHPLPNITYKDKIYNLGQFMSGELHLRELQQYCLDTCKEKKPLNLDEDNCASRFRDYDGWTVHRKRAWTTLFCGAHYDMIDFSIQPYLETGTEKSQRNIRTWMKHLSEFIHSLELETSVVFHNYNALFKTA